MKDVTTGTDTRDPRPLHQPLLGFDLHAETEALRAEPAWAEHGRTAKTLIKAGQLRIVVVALRAGGSIGDDDVYAPLAIQVLTGAVRADRAGDATDLPSGGLAVFEEGPGWQVTAVEDSIVLLTVTWPPERATEPAFI